MLDHCVAALDIASVGILGEQHRDFGLNRLRQESLRSLAEEFRHRVLSRQLWMWKRNRRMFVQGVSTPSRKGMTLTITQDTPPQPSSTTFEYNSRIRPANETVRIPVPSF
jgi:hypothetical protein